MRRYLICSDIHGYFENFISILSREHDVCAVLVAGDLEMKTSELMRETKNIPCYVVRGNCDYYRSPELPDELVITEGEHKIFLTHGHLYGVPHLKRLLHQAKDKGCDYVVFGHTHQYFEKAEEGVMFLNPGALKGRREWKTQTYMLIDFNDDGSIDIIKKRLWKG